MVWEHKVGHAGVTYKEFRKISVVKLEIYLVKDTWLEDTFFLGLSGDKLKGLDITHIVPRVLKFASSSHPWQMVLQHDVITTVFTHCESFYTAVQALLS